MNHDDLHGLDQVRSDLKAWAEAEAAMPMDCEPGGIFAQPERGANDFPAGVIYDDAPQTALLLTQQEWNDLAVMVAPYKFTTLKAPHIVRSRALAERIIEANQP